MKKKKTIKSYYEFLKKYLPKEYEKVKKRDAEKEGL
jgi:hypothetical protein